MVTAAAVSAMAAGPAFAERADGRLRIGITVVAASTTAAAAPDLPVPIGVTRIAAEGASQFDIARMRPEQAANVYRAALTRRGYALVAESAAADAWSSHWRRDDGGCVVVAVQPVVGTALVRIAARGVDCAAD